MRFEDEHTVGLPALRLSEEILFSAVNAVSEASLVSDSAGNTIYCTESFTRMTGYDIADIVGRSCRFLQGPDTDPGTVEDIRRALIAGQHYRGRILNYRRNGTEFWNHLSINPVRNIRGEVDGFVSVQRDVTAEVERGRDLHASRDDVTGLPSRLAILGSLRDMLDEAISTGAGVSVGVIDVDGFTAIGDEFGPAVGNHVLREFASRLNSRMRDQDGLTRLGGGRFLVLVRNLQEGEGSTSLAEITVRLLGAAVEPIPLPDERLIPITVSSGFSAWPLDTGELLGEHDVDPVRHYWRNQ
jgi:diguanylate cyclase (GGDEF)-like protein/PAS domain S-box-containing protein